MVGSHRQVEKEGFTDCMSMDKYFRLELCFRSTQQRSVSQGGTLLDLALGRGVEVSCREKET